MDLPHLDAQLAQMQPSTVSSMTGLSTRVCSSLASTIATEVATVPEVVSHRIRTTIPIAPETYRVELAAFQKWNDFALLDLNRGDPILVRAHVMTSLYVSFVWLRDSILGPVCEELPEGSALRAVRDFLGSGKPRRLRNAIAHGRWTYLPNFDGLECWDGRPLTRFTVQEGELNDWQLLSRGTMIAVLLAMTDSPRDP